MTAAIFPPKVAEFVEDMMLSATHRRMLHIGMALTKVSAMFQLIPGEVVPEQATLAFIASLEGLESGDAAEYAKCDAMASALWNEWMASREIQ